MRWSMDIWTGCKVLKLHFPPNLCPTHNVHLAPVNLHRVNILTNIWLKKKHIYYLLCQLNKNGKWVTWQSVNYEKSYLDVMRVITLVMQ